MAIQQTSFINKYCCTPIYQVICLPCTLIHLVSEVAKKIFYLIRYGKTNPFASTEEEKQQFEALVKSLSTVDSSPTRPPTPPPINFNATWEDAGKKMPLTGEAIHSKELKDFRVLAKQIASALTKQLIINSGRIPTEEADRNNIILGIGLICDKITEFIGTRLETPELATKLFDGILSFANEEARAHVAANKAAGKDTYHAEAQAIAASKQIAEGYHANPPTSDFPKEEARYVEAKKVLLEKAREGAIYHLEDFYYATYRRVFELTHDIKVTKERAAEAANNQSALQNIYFEEYKKALDEQRDVKKAHEAAAKLYEEKAGELNKDYVPLTEDFHEKCLQLYLQQCYVKTFIKQPAVSDDIKKLIEKMEACENIGEAQELYREHLRLLARDLLQRFIPIFVEMIGPALISSDFFKWLMKSSLGIEFKDTWIASITKIFKVFAKNPKTILNLIALKYPLEDKVISLLEKWILPEDLTHQFGSNIYPAIQKQILKMLCRRLIQNKIKEFAPIIYACTIDGKHALDLKNALWKEMTSEERKEFSLKGDHPLLTQEAFFTIVDELLDLLQKDQFLARKVILDLPQPEIESLAKEFQNLLKISQEDQKKKARATIEAIITTRSASYNKLVVPPDADPDRNQKLVDQGMIYGKHLHPLIAKIEKRLLQLPQTEQALTIQEIAKGIKSAVNDEPMEVTSFIGELTINIICNFADAKSWRTWALDWLSPVADILKQGINYHSSAVLEPFRSSFNEMAKTVTETVEAKLINEDKTGLDPKKVYDLYFGVGERKLNCDPELDVVARELFELVMLFAPKSTGSNWNWQNWTHWGAKKAITGEDSKHIKDVLTKVHRTFFCIQMINLSRMDRVFNIMKTIFDATPLPPPAANPPPAVPPLLPAS